MTGPFSTDESLVGVNYTVTFPRVPNLLFQFTQNGNILPGYDESFLWGSLNEVDNSTGSAVLGGVPVIVQSLSITSDTLVWTEAVSNTLDSNGLPIKNINYSTTFTNGVGLVLSFYHYTGAHVISYPTLGLSRTLAPDSIEFTFLVTNWQPLNASNKFLILLDTRADPYYADVIHTQTGNTYSVKSDIGNGVVIQTLNLFSLALVDGVGLEVNWYADPYGLSANPNLEILGFDLYFYWPIFTTSFYYDPDLSVLVNDQGSGTGGSDTTTILVAVLVPTLTIGVCIIAVVAVVVTLIVMRKRIFRLRERMRGVDQSSSTIIPD